MPPEITSIECSTFRYWIDDVAAVPEEYSVSPRYAPGERLERRALGVRVRTDADIVGEAVVSLLPDEVLADVSKFAPGLIGENPLDRERHWNAIKRRLRLGSRVGLGAVDIALWDFAGKYAGLPIHELLGTYRRRVSAYASTFHGQNDGGLDSPEAYADFAEECLDMGYRAFKIHGFDTDAEKPRHERDIDAVRAVGERVGDRMELMLDSSAKYETFARALKVGKACDRQGFLWYEDPYGNAGISQHGHRRLGELIETPLLQTEHVRGLEPHADFVATESTNFVRADPELDGGITGAMKISRVAEGFGLDVEYHAPGPAHRHCIAATRNTNFYEIAMVHPNCANPFHPPVYGGGYSDELDAIDDDGTVPIPDEPGLGVDVDWEYISEHGVSQTVFD